MWRRIQNDGLALKWIKTNESSKAVQSTFKKCQALAFLPPDDVLEGFNIIKDKAPSCMNPFINYFAKVYVGHFGLNKKKETIFKKPLYDVNLWNVRNRVLANKQKTTNVCESYHCSVKPDARSHRIELFYIILFYIFFSILVC